MVIAGDVSGIPAFIEICRAGFCPRPAERMFPTMASLMLTGSIPALDMASRAAITPNSSALKWAKLPLKFPMGVRAADTITTLLLLLIFLFYYFYEVRAA
jgi:hypothetical protein